MGPQLPDRTSDLAVVRGPDDVLGVEVVRPVEELVQVGFPVGDRDQADLAWGQRLTFLERSQPFLAFLLAYRTPSTAGGWRFRTRPDALLKDTKRPWWCASQGPADRHQSGRGRSSPDGP